MCILLLYMHVYICGCSKLQGNQRRCGVISTQTHARTFHSAKQPQQEGVAHKRNHANNGALSSQVFIFNTCAS